RSTVEFWDRPALALFFVCAVTRRGSSAGASPARQLRGRGPSTERWWIPDPTAPFEPGPAGSSPGILEPGRRLAKSPRARYPDAPSACPLLRGTNRPGPPAPSASARRVVARAGVLFLREISPRGMPRPVASRLPIVGRLGD